MAEKSKNIKIILVKGCFSHDGKTYEASPIPISIDEKIANQLITREVAVLPRSTSK